MGVIAFAVMFSTSAAIRKTFMDPDVQMSKDKRKNAFRGENRNELKNAC